MTNRPKQKGTAFETLIVRYAQDNGFPHMERRALHGNLDLGDLTGVPGVVFELKNTKTLNLGAHLTETIVEQRNARADYGILIQKRIGIGDPARQFFVMETGPGLRLLRAAGYGEAL